MGYIKGGIVTRIDIFSNTKKVYSFLKDNFDLSMFEFKNNGTGEFICDVSTSGPMEEGVTLVMDIILKLDIKWTYNNDVLSVEYTAADVNFKRLTVEPADPEFDAFFAQLKPMMEQKMAEELLASTKDNDDSAHVEFVDNNNVILHAFIDDIDLAIERVK